MGEARRRGTREQRVAQGRIKAAEREELRRLEWQRYEEQQEAKRRAREIARQEAIERGEVVPPRLPGGAGMFISAMALTAMTLNNNRGR